MLIREKCRSVRLFRVLRGFRGPVFIQPKNDPRITRIHELHKGDEIGLLLL